MLLKVGLIFVLFSVITALSNEPKFQEDFQEFGWNNVDRTTYEVRDGKIGKSPFLTMFPDNLYRSDIRKENVGDPLILTPMLEEGKVDEAQKASKVENFSNMDSYSGFFTVNKDYNSNLFFWFFPAAVSFWSTRPTPSHGRWSYYSFCTSLFKISQIKPNLSENSDRYWEECGSGRVDHLSSSLYFQS